jgi:hypothetical protein
MICLTLMLVSILADFSVSFGLLYMCFVSLVWYGSIPRTIRSS